MVGETEEIGIRYGLRRPPELTAEIASRRWREINRLLHSVMVLHSLDKERRPFHRILRTAGALVGAARGVLYLHPGGEGPLEMAAASGFSRALPERLRIAGILSTAALRAGKPLRVDPPAEPPVADEIRRLGGGSCLTIPVLREGQAWGVVQLLREEPFAEDEAVLLWIYALVLEDALPSLTEVRRGEEAPRTQTPHPALVGNNVFAAKLEWEIECARWAQRSCSLLEIGWRGEAGEEPPLRLSGVLRTIRRSLRPADLMLAEPDGKLLVFLPEADAAGAQQVARAVRRLLIQSRVLGDEARVTRSLRIAQVTCPDQGGRRDDLLRALSSQFESISG